MGTSILGHEDVVREQKTVVREGEGKMERRWKFSEKYKDRAKT